MHLILVPGFWLGAWSWDRVTPALEAAGHTVTALTLPGLESVDSDRSDIGLADHVAAVVAHIDATGGPVVLVGHSGAGSVVHAAVDQRPGIVARAIYVDSGPMPDGGVNDASLPSDGADLPLPPWDVFRGDGARDLDDLTDQQLDEFRVRAVPTPAGAARDPQVLSDELRFGVPVTIISTTFTRDEVEAAIEAGEPYFAEIPRLAHFTLVELPTGHWPQLTKPEQLAEVILNAL